MKILVACCTLQNIARAPYVDHARFFYRLGKDAPKDWTFFQFFNSRLSIDRFRNAAFQQAVRLQCDYLFFYDDDMQFNYDVFFRLQETGFDIVGARNYIRGYPFDLMTFIEDEDGQGKRLRPATDEEIDNPENLATYNVFPCRAIGTAVALIKMEKVREMPAPWFITGPSNTEDIYFCMKATDFASDIQIGTRVDCITGHQLEPEVISKHTKSHLKKYYEGFMPDSELELIKTGDRGQGYVDENIESRLRAISSKVE